MGNTLKDSNDSTLFELERKFLLPCVPKFVELQPSDEIIQGYLDNLEIIKEGNNYKIAFKNIDGNKNFGLIEKSEFDFLWIKAKKISLKETKYYLSVGKNIFEIINYKNFEGLFTVNVKFNSIEEAKNFIAPDWFGQEVTKDSRFENKNLAKSGITDDMLSTCSKKVENILSCNEPINLALHDGITWIINGIKKLLESKKDKNPIIVLICGGSSSGKTVKVTKEIISILTQYGITSDKISMDNFYKGPTFMNMLKKAGVQINYDQPEAFNLELFQKKMKEIKLGKDEKIPSYDFKNDPIPDKIEVKKAQVILVEGLYTLRDEVEKYGDLKVFVDVSTHGRVIRRLLRDVLIEGRTGQTEVEALDQILTTVEPMDKIYIQPQKHNAHIILNNDHDPNIESVNIPQKQDQIKFMINNIDIDSLIKGIFSLGLDSVGTFDEDDFYYSHSKKDLLTSGEIFRIRKIGNEAPLLTYKFPIKNENIGRNENIFQFKITNEIKKLIGKEYLLVGKISKTRHVFVKGNISIVLDFDVFGKKSGVGKGVDFGNYIEIRGNGNKEEFDKIFENIKQLIKKTNKEIVKKNYIEILFSK